MDWTMTGPMWAYLIAWLVIVPGALLIEHRQQRRDDL